MERKDKIRLILASAALLLGLGSLALGVFRGEPGVLLQKAVNICFECIGLG